jgi:hypothetical protein
MMTDLQGAYSELSRQIKEMMEAGSDARPISLDVHRDTDGVHAILEFQDGTLTGVTFEDSESYTLERRETLEASFAVVCAFTLAMSEAA